MTIRHRVICSVLVAAFLLIAACSGKERPTLVGADYGGASGAPARAGAPARGGGTSTAGIPDSGGTGGDGGTASVLDPVVVITTPEAATDPNVDPVLVDDQVTVLCTVTASAATGAKPVDASSVKIEMLDADGKSLKSFAGVPTAQKNEYSASFVLQPLPSGVISFKCSASDTASPAHQASTSVDTLVDRGPEIMLDQPADKSAHPQLGAMNVKFSVASAPIAAGDKQAGVTAVTLTIGGTVIPTAAKSGGVYQASVNFADKGLFDSPPSGDVPIVIAATNGRKHLGKGTRSLTYGIVVDGVGPVIAFSTPLEEAVVGRATTMAFTVTDAGSGVDPVTVKVLINNTAYAFNTTDGQWTGNAGTGAYSFKVGTVLAHEANTEVTVNVSAADKAGNTATGGRVFHLDNVPPTVDLDPEAVYEVRPGTSDGTLQCSSLFDPLGPDAPNDAQRLTNAGRFRALVWDETNRKTGVNDHFYALTDKASVRLYVQADPSSPLLADDDGDKICDEIWTGLAPHQRKPTDVPLPLVELKPIEPTTNATVTWGAGSTPPTLSTCEPGGTTPASSKLCSESSGMTMVIRHPTGTRPPFEPVIYARDPTAGTTDLGCTGQEWVVSTASGTTKVGWICMAARALDNVGNVGISAPLRICLRDEAHLDDDPCAGIEPPSCTDGCTPPPHFHTQAVLNN